MRQYVGSLVQHRCIQANLGIRSSPDIEAGADLSSFSDDSVDCLIIAGSAK